jgi:hypothetical protein
MIEDLINKDENWYSKHGKAITELIDEHQKYEIIQQHKAAGGANVTIQTKEEELNKLLAKLEDCKRYSQKYPEDRNFKAATKDTESEIKNTNKHIERLKIIQKNTQRLKTDVRKVISQIINTVKYSTNTFEGRFIKALGQGEIIYLPDETIDKTDKNIENRHAEMRILTYLQSTRNKRVNQGPIYIGISKLCCANCYDAITQFNSSVALVYSEEKPLSMEEIITKKLSQKYTEYIAVRGSHRHGERVDKAKGSWNPPSFFENFGFKPYDPDGKQARDQEHDWSDSDYDEEELKKGIIKQITRQKPDEKSQAPTSSTSAASSSSSTSSTSTASTVVLPVTTGTSSPSPSSTNNTNSVPSSTVSGASSNSAATSSLTAEDSY